MKRLIFIILFTITTIVTNACNYTLVLTDQYSDGWGNREEDIIHKKYIMDH